MYWNSDVPIDFLVLDWLNRNIGCIEMLLILAQILEGDLLNRNIGCIEILICLSTF